MTSSRREELQKKNLLNLLESGAFRFVDADAPWFPYTSGQIGPYYVQSTAIEKDGESYSMAIESLAEFAESETPGFDVISGGETRDWDFSNPVAVIIRKPHAKLYKNGTALGAEMRGKAVLHVSDLNNEGSSARDYWKPVIERNGGKLVGLLSFVDRMEDGFTMLRNLGLSVVSVVPLNERAWSIAREAGYVSASLYASLVERMRDRRAWAIRALLERPKHFAAMFHDTSTRNKAIKIMETYPEIREELNRIINSPASP